MSKKYVAECIGTFMLSLVVFLSASGSQGAAALTPLFAGLVLGLCVYTLGPVSGCHINPAVTLGALSLKKISGKDAVAYIVAQFAGAAIALFFATMVFKLSFAASPGTFSFATFSAEMIGTFLFTFGIAAVIFGSVPEDASGIVIGGSLLVGVVAASLAGSAGILNPAVAFALHSLDWTYALAPVLGSVLGMQVYKTLV